jgi:hypothetical protein
MVVQVQLVCSKAGNTSTRIYPAVEVVAATREEATSMAMELMEEIVDSERTWRNVRVIDNSNKEGGTL